MAPKKKNAFYMFMSERKPEVEKQLKRKVAFSELPDLLYNDWKSLSEEEKLFYKSLCKGANQSLEKYDSRGIPLSLIQELDEAKHMKELEMKKSIRTTVDMLKTGKSIAGANFFLIHMSYYVHLENDTYVPAEIGVVNFSFAKGVFSTFHRIFPPKIPVGYHYEAMTHSQETHNLMVSLTKDLRSFEDDMIDYLLKDGKRLPCLYTQNEEMEAVESMLTKFKFKVPPKVYSLDCLYQLLYSATNREIPESIATHALLGSVFDYAPKISCDWHDNFAPDSIKYCSLSCCHRWVFNMCNSIRIQETFGIIPQKGNHFPDFGNFKGIADVYQPKFSSSEIAEDDDEKSFTPIQNTRSPVQNEAPNSSGDSDSGSVIGVNLGKTKVMAGIPIGCLGLTGFGRGKRKVKN